MKVTLPSRIDRSVMPSLSGANQGALIAALRYIRLITDDVTPTTDLAKLAKAQDTDRKKILKELLARSYSFLFSESFRLQSSTPRQLEEQFSTNTLATGDTVKKCIAFFLAAAKDADMELSPYLKKMRYTKTVRSTRRNQSTGFLEQGDDPETVETNPPDGLRY